MDLVTTGLLNSFKVQQGFADDLSQSTLFEHFANFCVASNEYPEDFELQTLSVAGGNDLQLDGVMVIVNGVLVEAVEEVDDLLTTNKYIDAEFVFVQAKMSSDFSGSEISNMFFGIRDLFAVSPKLPRNASLQEKEKVLRKIYTLSAHFRHGNPRIHLYYVTTGKWMADGQLKNRIDTEVATLDELNIFSSIRFTPVDARSLHQLFKRAQNLLSKTITFASRVTLPAIEGVKESYLGYLPAPEYLKMITDDSETLLRGIFYENVRDFQGDNPVNVEIEATLNSAASNAFVLLNNGVTVVSEDLGKTGDSFTVSGFQIVNGCQTSHVLYNNRDKLNANVLVPIKLIVAPIDSLRTQIVKATNRQTVVKIEELAALTDFQKSLESFYEAVPVEHKLYYERRSQQFRSSPSLEKIRIVTISTQIRTFASMFLNRAHQASRYYGSLLKDVENTIFVEGHFTLAYYVSAYAMFRLESLLRRGLIDGKYRPFKYQMLGVFRVLVAGADMPDMKANKFEKYCESIKLALWDVEQCETAFHAACDVLDEVLVEDFDRDTAKDSALQPAVQEVAAHYIDA